MSPTGTSGRPLAEGARLCRADRPAVRGRLAVGEEGVTRTPVRALLPRLALLYAAGGMMAGLPLAFRYQLRQGEGLTLQLSAGWPAPQVAGQPGLERRPVMVTVGYRIDPAHSFHVGHEPPVVSHFVGEHVPR
jgi:hypothetical protein